MWLPWGAQFDPCCTVVDSAPPHWWTEERLESSLSLLKPLRSPSSSSFGTLTRAVACDDFALLLYLYLPHPMAKWGVLGLVSKLVMSSSSLEWWIVMKCSFEGFQEASISADWVSLRIRGFFYDIGFLAWALGSLSPLSPILLDSFEPLPVLGRSSSSRSWKILVELPLPLPWSLCVAWTEVRAQLIPDSWLCFSEYLSFIFLSFSPWN